ncbi:uncharacterized protein LOC129760083, partial [Uranotaenia lowii]|uniref:uncharacterized protein LOC129760083 n=1 Tax=Uranotaenia lowii TaxID=190385 RepID=UPI0024785BAE
MNTLLIDRATYKIIKRNPTSSLQSKNNDLVKRLEQLKLIDAKLAKKLRTYKAVCPRIYGQPKAHKPGLPLRPVVPCMTAPSYQLSKYVGSIIQRSLTPKYSLKNSMEFNEYIKGVTIPPGYVMASFDVVSLFTSIPKELVRKSIFKHWSRLSMQTPICLDIFWEMVEFCMDSSYFCFNNTFYQQTSGLAMGSPIASPIAELTLDDLLDDAIEACVTPPLHIKKYVDDLFLVLPPTQVNEIKNVFNAQHENVQFTVEMEENESLPFLDMLLHRNEEVYKIECNGNPDTSEEENNEHKCDACYIGCTIVKLKQRMSQHKTQTNELKRLWEKGYTNEDYAIIQLRQQTALIEHEAAMHHLFDIDKVKIIDR